MSKRWTDWNFWTLWTDWNFWTYINNKKIITMEQLRFIETSLKSISNEMKGQTLEFGEIETLKALLTSISGSLGELAKTVTELETAGKE